MDPVADVDTFNFFEMKRMALGVTEMVEIGLMALSDQVLRRAG